MARNKSNNINFVYRFLPILDDALEQRVATGWHLLSLTGLNIEFDGMQSEPRPNRSTSSAVTWSCLRRRWQTFSRSLTI